MVGFVIEEQERAQSGEERYALTERDAAVGEASPLVRAAGRALYDDPDERFEEQLAVLLDGVAGRLGTG